MNGVTDIWLNFGEKRETGRMRLGEKQVQHSRPAGGAIASWRYRSPKKKQKKKQEEAAEEEEDDEQAGNLQR